MFCSKCKKEKDRGGKYCPECGSALASKEEIEGLGPEGLGGWLWFITIGLILIFGFSLFDVFTYSEAFDLAFKVRATYPLYGFTVGFEWVTSALSIIFSGYLIYLFFNKRKNFPKLFITLLIASPTVIFIDTVLASSIPIVEGSIVDAAWIEFWKDVVRSGIWIAYTLKSKRVRNTFVN